MSKHRTPRHITGRQLVTVAMIGAAIGMWLSPGRAYADQLEPADRDVSRVKVTYVEPVGRVALYVELNNGAAYKLRPCVYEDGSGQRGCYWDANDSGNNVGRSFVVISGDVVYSRMIGAAR